MVILEGMFLIRTTPLRTLSCMMDYTHFLLARHGGRYLSASAGDTQSLMTLADLQCILKLLREIDEIPTMKQHMNTYTSMTRPKCHLNGGIF